MKIYDIAFIGAGPATITAVLELIDKGYNANEIELVSDYTTSLSEEMRELKELYNKILSYYIYIMVNIQIWKQFR